MLLCCTTLFISTANFERHSR